MPGIIVDETLCTRCNTCATVCVTGIIEKTSGSNFPEILEVNKENCLKCGHCESFCTMEALTLDFFKEEKIINIPAEGKIDPDNLSLYLKMRRSVRHFSPESVPRDSVSQIIDVARYAASGGNAQPVKWIVIHESENVKKIAALTIEWMKTLQNTSHPLADYVSDIISIWDNGTDLICHKAPHLLFTHIPVIEPIDDPTEAVIAMTYFDIAAPSFGVGTCWAGFVKMAADFYMPLQKALSLPEGRRIASAMMFGYSSYKATSIPRRNPADITWC